MLRLFILLFLSPFLLFSAEEEVICEVDNENLPEITEMISTELKVGLLLVQFADWEENDDARGSVGYNLSEPDDEDLMTLHDKYHYQDYWNIFFSGETYVDPEAEEGIGGLHPDWDSHQSIVWGSFKDYWWEVSHTNLTITAPTTRVEILTGDEMLDKGIINNINADGTIEWVTLSGIKSSYISSGKVAEAAEAQAHQDFLDGKLETDVWDNTKFDHIIVKFAGTNSWGIATIYRSTTTGIGFTINSERMTGGGTETAHLNGFGVDAHEFGHLLGYIDLHQQTQTGSHGVGIFSLMGWGSNYEIGKFLPAHLDPWNKLTSGWLGYDIINTVTSGYTLKPVSDINQVGNPKVAILNLNDDPIPGDWNGDYFILENRSGIGFDRRFTFSDQSGFTGGMVIWRKGLNQNFSNNLKIMVVEADVDARYPLGDGDISHEVNTGGKNDFFPGPLSNTSLDDNTLPYLRHVDDDYSHWAISGISYDGELITITEIDPFNGLEIINTNETWSVSKTLNSDVVVEAGGKLTINPGTTVEINNSEKVRIWVKPGAELDINGTEQSPVVFQAINQGTDKNWWHGIEIENGAVITLSGIVIKNATTAFNFSNAALGDVTIDNVQIYNCENAINTISAGNFTFNNSHFENTKLDLRNLSIVTNSQITNTTIEYFGLHSASTLAGCNLFNSTIICDGSSPSIKGNTFSTSFIKIEGSGSPIVKNNIFAGDNSGEAIKMGYWKTEEWVNNSSAIIENNTFSKYEFAIAIYDNSGDTEGEPIVKNNIFYQNQKTEEDFIKITSASTASYNCFDNIDNTGAPANGQNGNIGADPLFVDSPNNDFHLTNASPCIDAGDPTSDHSNEPQPSVNINMGAYGNTTEATMNTLWARDMNVSGDVSVGANTTLNI